MILGGLNGPPAESDLPGLERAMRQVLQQSATLDDRKKVVAECKSSGCEDGVGPWQCRAVLLDAVCQHLIWIKRV